jgi:hypothetical protein
MNAKLILLAIGISLLLIGCYTERPRGHSRGPDAYAQYSYIYYPDAEVYYEPNRHVYFWVDRGEWRSGPRVPRNIVLHSSVSVDLNSPEPYRHHDEVRARHPPHREEHRRERGHGHQDRDERSPASEHQ